MTFGIGIGARVAVGAGVLWAATVAWSLLPPTAKSYEDLAGNSAQDALGATGTVLLVGQGELDGRLLPTFTANALADSAEAIATATQGLLAAPVPDDSSNELRSELIPLLLAASDGVTALQAALDDEDTNAAQAVLDGLAPVRDDLDEFVEDQQ